MAKKQEQNEVTKISLQLKKLRSDAKNLASQISEETLNQNSDWLVEEYGIDRYLEMKAMVTG